MKKFWWLVLVFVLVLSVGCASQVKEQKTTELVAPGYPLVLTDATGNTITLNKKPEKIVSLTLVSDELLLSLAEVKNIKAISVLADDPSISNLADKAKQVKGRVRADPERVIAEQPDLVLMADWQPQELVKILRDAKIPVYVYQSPKDFTQLRETIMTIAKLVGQEDAGKNLVGWMDNELKTIEQKLAKNEKKITVLQYNSFGSTSGSNTMFDDIVKHAGLVNAASQAGLEKYPSISKEKIVELSPDIIFVPSWSASNVPSSQLIADILNDKSLAAVKAVKNGRVICIDDRHMSSLSHYVVYGVGDMAKAAYPELFKE